MRWLFWLIALFGLAAAIALGARLNDGYVLLVFPPWRMEISLNLFIFAFAAFLFIAYGLIHGLARTLALPQRAREFRQRRNRERSFATLQDAMRLLFEGRFGQALKKAGEAHETGVASGLSALIAARAAQRMRETQKQSGWVERAKVDDPRYEAAALMLEAEMSNEIRAYDDALTALATLQKKHGRHLAALLLELRARQGRGDWDEVLRLARQLEKRDAMAPVVAHEIRLAAHLENVKNRNGDSPALLAYLRGIPERESDARLVLAVARELHAMGEENKAAEVIEAYIDLGQDARWHGDLVTLYGKLNPSEMTGCIAKAEKWLLQQPQDAELLLALGRLCRRQRLWGKAQSYLEASLAVGRTPVAHLELAQLFDQLEKTEDANRHYRRSVELAL